MSEKNTKIDLLNKSIFNAKSDFSKYFEVLANNMEEYMSKQFKPLQQTIDRLSKDPIFKLMMSKVKDNSSLLNKDARTVYDFFKEYQNRLYTFDKTEINKLEELISIIPSKYYIPNNKLSNELNKNLLGNGDTPIIVANKNKKNEITTIVNLAYTDKGIQLFNKSNFTSFDRTVHNAVCTLFEAGNIDITPIMVYRCMNGLTNSEYVTPQALGAVTKSLDKTRLMNCKIDFTEEAKSRNIPDESGNITDESTYLYEDVILSASKLTKKTGGHKVTVYRLNKTPILYEYAKLTKQIISIPVELLKTQSAKNSTKEVIVLREYLLKRIEIMKRNKKQNNKILFDTIFQELELENPTKQKAARIREAIRELLKYWKQKKYIKSFEEYKEGRKFKGISITY